jgi:GlcNAc-P-P-Und epimerase
VTAVIFGGTGFIGQHLARWLVDRGETAVLLADIAPPVRALDEHVRYVPCDVREPIGFDPPSNPTVYNLAAVHRTPGHLDHEYFDTNVAGAQNIVAFCDRAGATRLTFTSSIAVYGPSESPVTEATAPHPTSAYGASKLEAERIHTEWLENDRNRKLVIVRPGTIFGPGEGGNFTRLATTLARRRFVYPGRRDTVKACGYVEDLLESLRFAEGLAAPGVTYNFGFAQPPTIEEVCSAFVTVGGFATPRVTIPTGVMLAAAKTLTIMGASDYNAERVLKLVRSTYIVPASLISANFPYRFNLESALADWYQREPAGQFV